ncbi:Serine/threonine protein kinase [Amycolatopsis marina]|uniref:non-specific serine/threonine protein kinase n=1 Tax=Amycolatopsis marina TaxID=490629 RepID=A0A1I1A2H2_9PSEU|nr:serine/threonine-protein kinase [Amycolatopsis marina]SFB32189.1 Serine/threonine protein kinase [Amycolatopsis marina]
MATEGTHVGGRYRLDQPIGRGHAGIVWLAYDTRLHRTVAAKRLYIAPDLDPAQAEQRRAVALQEGRDAIRVVHPNAISVLDALREGDDVWLVMEYVPSRNMADFLAEHGRLTPEQAAFLGGQLGSALAVAHSVGVPHRVLEPGNVLLADDGGVKITDIGISGSPPDPAYRAPEVARGEPATAASDAFSLGATLFAAVEGAPPFGSEGTGDQAAPTHAGPLTGALLKLLRSDPAKRPTMPDTVTALGAITQGRQQAFVPPTAPAMPTVRAMAAAAPGQPQYASSGPQQPPAQQRPQQHQVRPSAPPPAPTRTGPNVRAWVLTAAAILLAILLGVLVVELLFL